MIGKKLASNTTLYKGLCICPGHGPEETYTEGLAYKCRRYALEAIINDIIYLRVHIMFMFHAITAMILESAISTRLRGRLICTCGIINGKKYS